eukprot:scpid52447/ scgid17666/ Transcription intermediary factor 1-beta; E3 SUMO-protein ligase TRIM28; KRAB-associated protein 1; KRAB-interacting protein 1; Nuclear corepressor KAP-1; RING finger protein 96; Tripartite motif-containing protein 28
MMAQPSLALGPRQVVGEADFQKCMVCGTDSGRSARLLKCLHNVCEECLADSLSAPDNSVSGGDSSRKSILCYLCQATSEVATVLDGPGSLLKNYVLTRQWLRNRLLRSITTVQSAASSTDAENLQQLVCDECDVCPEDADEVVAVCYDCCSTLCVDHLRIHKKTRGSAKHTVCELASVGAAEDPLSKAGSAEGVLRASLCEVHPKEVCVSLCRQCRSGFCSLCQANKAHAEHGHTVQPLDAESLTAVETKLRDGVLPSLNEHLEDLGGRLDALCKDEEAIAQQCQDLSADITDHVEKLKADVLAELDRQELSLRDELDKHHWKGSKKVAEKKAPLLTLQALLERTKYLAGELDSIPTQAERFVLMSHLIDASSDIDSRTRLADPGSCLDKTLHVSWTSPASYQPLLGDSTIGHVQSGPTASTIKAPPPAATAATRHPDSSPVSDADWDVSAKYAVLGEEVVLKVNFSSESSKFDNIGEVTKEIYRQASLSDDFSLIDLHAVPMTSSTKMFCSQKPVEFRVPPVAGTYRLEAKELLILHRVILPPLPFDFSKAVFQNAESRDSGRTVVALGQETTAGSVTCRPVLRSAKSATWHIFCRSVGSTWNAAFGIVQPPDKDTGTSIPWRRRHTAAIFYEFGSFYYAVEPGEVEKSSVFEPGVHFPSWQSGSLFRITISRLEEDFDSGYCLHRVDLAHKKRNGSIHVAGWSADMRPYFWLPPQSSFSLLPPY